MLEWIQMHIKLNCYKEKYHITAFTSICSIWCRTRPITWVQNFKSFAHSVFAVKKMYQNWKALRRYSLKSGSEKHKNIILILDRRKFLTYLLHIFLFKVLLQLTQWSSFKKIVRKFLMTRVIFQNCRSYSTSQ
jgi:hypothetical protein